MSIEALAEIYPSVQVSPERADGSVTVTCLGYKEKHPYMEEAGLGMVAKAIFNVDANGKRTRV